MKQAKAYEEHSSTFAHLQLQRAQKERDMLKLKYEKADTARILWKLAAVAMAAFIFVQTLGGNL
ncbi:hypothetical protein FZC84_12005 [Rossellomorea vietnamensis]|uniref:Uncharacterized protein n=1 Tax=Rossellomorea vietnamensis TaxID=218284 RepID=A0A5D4MBJ3_9BACI|nr:hypothetical protein [Rossellomorea vietnamensis]TYR99092.1 hypothetical protein FZC84_12005 [Rossellomorea vietnamensis]